MTERLLQHVDGIGGHRVVAAEKNAIAAETLATERDLLGSLVDAGRGVDPYLPQKRCVIGFRRGAEARWPEEEPALDEGQCSAEVRHHDRQLA